MSPYDAIEPVKATLSAVIFTAPVTAMSSSPEEFASPSPAKPDASDKLMLAAVIESSKTPAEAEI